MFQGQINRRYFFFVFSASLHLIQYLKKSEISNEEKYNCKWKKKVKSTEKTTKKWNVLRANSVCHGWRTKHKKNGWYYECVIFLIWKTLHAVVSFRLLLFQLMRLYSSVGASRPKNPVFSLVFFALSMFTTSYCHPFASRRTQTNTFLYGKSSYKNVNQHKSKRCTNRRAANEKKNENWWTQRWHTQLTDGFLSHKKKLVRTKRRDFFCIFSLFNLHVSYVRADVFSCT